MRRTRRKRAGAVDRPALLYDPLFYGLRNKNGPGRIKARLRAMQIAVGQHRT